MEETRDTVNEKKPKNPKAITAAKVWGYYWEGRDLSSKFRQEAQIDANYYDNEQWTEEEKNELKDRGQPPIVINRIKPVIDLVIGTQAKARVDFSARPRKSAYVLDAGIATECLKYVMDQNDGEFVVSGVFKTQIKAGWQWVEICKNPDPLKELIQIVAIPRNDLIWDPLAKEFDRGDGKYFIRAKWLELEDAIALFPKWKEQLEKAVSTEEVETFRETPYHGTEDQPDRPGVTKWEGSVITSAEWVDKTRKRVKLIECWYKTPKETWFVENDQTGDVEELDPDKIMQVLATPGAKLTKKVIRKVRFCIVAGNNVLQDVPSPHRHNEYPFVPFWCFIKDKDNSPYGMIRQRRDPQDEVNKRRSKAMHLMNSRQLIATTNAIDQKQNDWKKVASQVNDPEAVILLDAMAQNPKFEIVSPAALVDAQYKFEQEAKQDIEEMGVNRELQGLESNASSGRAIIARQVQGNMMIGEPFENYRRSRQMLGQRIWSMIQQHWTKPKVIRITDKLGNHNFITLNEPIDGREINESLAGKIFIRNDITRAKVDIVIDEQAFNATIRESLSNQMFELISKLPPEVGLLLLDEAIDLLDLPNKDRLLAKISQAQGVMADQAKVKQENERMIAEATQNKAMTNMETKGNIDRRPEEAAMRQGL